MPVSALVRTRFRTVAARFGAAAVAVCCAAAMAGCSSESDPASSIVRTTTSIAGAGVVGLERDTTQACPLPSAPDASGATRSVTHAAGVTEVPADPQRIVVLTTSALDAACAVGLWERVVGAVTVPGERPQPMFLGYGVLEIPGLGTAAAPDPAKIAELNPDVILGDVPSGAATYEALSAIAPTVLVGSPANWQAEFTAYAEGLNRRAAADAALTAYRTEARETGVALAAELTEASVVRITADTVQVQGDNSFAGQVLADVGVRRPAAQRRASFDVQPGAYATEVEGDLVYVILAGPEGTEYGERVMRGDEWKDLGASTDRRVFAVEDHVWRGDGLTAARALLTDLRDTLNGYVND
ncbi:ABC transporter substrate-binding protein [Nocardia puris]|uniref:Iron complex transport system substrate-binding protein n=1 Tax=Nocardia puris TaxID=208602 RepID=A0A366E3U2_9NOCA|nr:ABC transporter substrate-binding protein [Nocardia puris]MBF6214702.1 ABC transporter substrate-binding protein [Nocardia puris]MBF6368824.1 ABC transporter substrate-binding protein [Nocardia puris]MBF6462404.1 ABC transporter substrate-binding protein [Nocardia puris]RBO96982.1 iron complex transport system substrate-binding protein [Nocardia puris]